MGVAAGIVALVVLLLLLIGLAVNHRSLVGMRERRDELGDRMAGMEARMGQLAELERRQAAAARRTVPPVTDPAGRVQRVPPPRVVLRQTPKR